MARKTYTVAVSGGVETPGNGTPETRSTGEKHLFDSGGKIGAAAQPVKTGHVVAGHAMQCQAGDDGPAR